MMDPTILPLDVRRRLAKARTLGKLSGRQLSSLAGMASNYSAMIERGASRHPAFWVVSRLACVLGVSLDWLARGEGEPPTREQVLSAVERARASKAAFDSAREAHATCRKAKRLSGVRPYRCRACGRWHLGRTLKPIR